MSTHNVESLPQYPGEDTRPTSKKELAGWYCYGWAAEVFVVCAMGKCFFTEFLCLFLWDFFGTF
jgi:MFS-type transporter involved in bile tolerance (Atg22 family)